MKNIIYLKQTTNYDDILKNKHNRMPTLFKKLIFLYKNICNVITKKNVEGYNIWVLPIIDRYPFTKIDKLLKKAFIDNKENTYLLSRELKENKIYKLMNKYNITYITEERIKKILLIKILEYICDIQKEMLNNIELTIMINNTSELNMYIIEELSKIVKNLKIVSLNIYKFKKIEQKIYDEYGIGIQFSNSYRKSLEKSKVIINFDFNEIEINEYEIYNNAIIINCTDNNIKIKSKIFNGIVVNSCNIEFTKEIINNFKKANIYEHYTRLLLYASIIEKENDIFEIYNHIDKSKVMVTNLIGNNGIINKKEFKNIDKKLDKNKKTE